MKVVTTGASKKLNIKIREFHAVVPPGVVFTVDDDARYVELSGNNKFNAQFVVPYNEEDYGEIEVKIPEIEEEPEVFVIEPGKDPVKVDETLTPIEEVAKPTKTRSTKPKTARLVVKESSEK